MTTTEGEESEVVQQLAVAEPALAEIRAANEQEILAMAQLGAMVNPESLTKVRLDAFIEFVFMRLGNVPPEVQKLLAVMFETEFEEKVAVALKEVKGDVRKAMLAQGSGASQADLKRMHQAERRNGNGGGLFKG